MDDRKTAEVAGKTAEEVADFEKRCNSVREEISPILENYKIGLGGKINYLEGGLIPSATFIDLKGVETGDKAPKASDLA